MVDTPATFGGKLWDKRPESHENDVASGLLWRTVGMHNEWSPLTDVLISTPSADFGKGGEPNAHMMLSWPDLAALVEQCDGVERFFESVGVTVHRHSPKTPPPLNYLFMRDLFLMTPSGAIVARPASPVRAAEARFVTQALSALGIAIIASPTGTATFEGADTLWLDASTLLVGTGARTNPAGLAWLTHQLSEMGVEVIALPVPAGAQHLLGVMVPLSKTRMIVDGERMSPALDGLLCERELERLVVPPSDENRQKRAMNVVVLGPDSLAMPSGCPELAAQFSDDGVSVHTLKVDAYVEAAGALGCLTAIIRRECSR